MNTLKAVMVALVLLVPTQVSAGRGDVAFCESISEIAFNVAVARDVGVPVLDAYLTLVKAGLPDEVSSKMSLNVYFSLGHMNPFEVKTSYYSVCISEAV
jgi:hypothetical protein